MLFRSRPQWSNNTPQSVFVMLDKTRRELGLDWDPWTATNRTEIFLLREWVSTALKSWSVSQATSRFRGVCGDEATVIPIRFRHIPHALTAREAVASLEQAGVVFESTADRVSNFKITKSKSGVVVVNELTARCVVNEALKGVWGGTVLINERRICCSRAETGSAMELTQRDQLRVVSASSKEQLLKFEAWVYTMQALGLEEFDIKELLLASFDQTQENRDCVWDCQIWHPFKPRSVQQVWRGSESAQGQIRLVRWTSDTR